MPDLKIKKKIKPFYKDILRTDIEKENFNYCWIFFICKLTLKFVILEIFKKKSKIEFLEKKNSGVELGKKLKEFGGVFKWRYEPEKLFFS